VFCGQFELSIGNDSFAPVDRCEGGRETDRCFSMKLQLLYAPQRKFEPPLGTEKLLLPLVGSDMRAKRIKVAGKHHNCDFHPYATCRTYEKVKLVSIAIPQSLVTTARCNFGLDFGSNECADCRNCPCLWC